MLPSHHHILGFDSSRNAKCSISEGLKFLYTMKKVKKEEKDS